MNSRYPVSNIISTSSLCQSEIPLSTDGLRSGILLKYESKQVLQTSSYTYNLELSCTKLTNKLILNFNTFFYSIILGFFGQNAY